jgi:hypothetical protein
MTQHASPDMDRLVASGASLAAAIQQPPPDRVAAGAFFHAILLKPWDEGGRELWEGFGKG